MDVKRITSNQTINVVALKIATALAQFGQKDRDTILSKTASVLKIIPYSE